VSILGPTFPNRLFLHSAQTDRLDDSISFTSLPTIWVRLAAAGVSANYYYSNIPVVALWGTKYLGISRSYDDFKSAAQNGTLPAVSYVDPLFTTIDDGLGNDDHPHADIRRGDRFLFDTFEAVAGGPAWNRTVLIITFDEWGGFFEHVPPPRATAANNVDTDLVNGKALLGFRVPVVIASPSRDVLFRSTRRLRFMTVVRSPQGSDEGALIVFWTSPRRTAPFFSRLKLWRESAHL
jgi:phospholipase C